MKKKIAAALALSLACVFSTGALAADLLKVRTTNEDERVRVVFQLDELPPSWDFQYIKSKHRIRLVLADTVNRNTEAMNRGGILKGLQFEQDGKDLVIEAQLQQAVRHSLTTLRKPPRLVLDAFAAAVKPELEVRRELSPGVVWRDIEKTPARGRVNYHLVTVKAGTAAGLAMSEKAFPVAQAAKRLHAVAAINGPAGDLAAVYAQGKWLKKPKRTEGALVYRGKKGFAVVRLTAAAAQSEVLIGKQMFPVAGYNRARHADEIILYTPAYGKSTGTNRYGAELTVRRGKVTAMAQTGDVKIPRDGAVISGHGKYEDILAAVAKGTAVRLPDTDLVTGTEFIYAGGELILRDGKNLLDPRHDDVDSAPRTVVGTKRDGTLLLLVADGYRAESRGLTRYECAEIMRQAGAEAALVWPDKGGATLYADGKVVNHPEPTGREGKRFRAALIIYGK